MLDVLSEIGNFSYTITDVPDGVAGTMQPDGSWNGMIGQLMAEVGIFRFCGGGGE